MTDSYATLVVDGDEIATLLSTLERIRRTFAWKCGGLDAGQLRVTVAASTMTLGGLLKHLAHVEADWFAVKLRGEPIGPPWDAAEPGSEWSTAASDSPESLYALWESAVTRSRALVAAALAEGDAGRPGRFTWPDGRTPNLRRIIADMIEEYARHTGHADLLREAVDGLVGEDAPA
ncbi:DinB family protein [Amycolatopsis sp. NPDC005961]|uniref:DinB family protein n=1 Tax=Amycolatopsis sp. NPDC005961 TaxID=3156720 RepID=UPI0033F35381